MTDESHLPFSEQSLSFRLRKRAEIRRANTERKSVLEGRPDRVADLLEEAAAEIDRLRDAALQSLGLFEMLRGHELPFYNQRLKTAEHLCAVLNGPSKSSLEVKE